jgi:hypothetical protein
MKKYISLILIVLGCVSVSAQIAVGSFRSHMAMHGFLSLAVDANTIYAASSNGLMLLDKSTIYGDDPDIATWSKVDGLSDIDIVKIFHEDKYNSLIICYINGNIDVIRDDKLTNVRDVKDKSISASKQIQNCRFYDGKAYMVYPFGVVVLDLEQLIILDTWFTKRQNDQLTATDVVRNSQRFYVSTAEGVYSIPVTSQTLSDFSVWTEENTMNVIFLSEVSDRIFAVRKASEEVEGELDTLVAKEDGEWRATDKGYLSVRAVNSQNDTLMVCSWDRVELLDVQGERLYQVTWYNGVYTPDARDCALDHDVVWVADHSLGLVLNNMTYYSNLYFSASGPYADYVEKVTSLNGIVAAVHGSRKASTAFSPGYRYPAASWFQNQEWHFNDFDFLNYDPTRQTYDLTDIAINPKDETEWCVASWGNGIFKCKDHRVVAHYNAANSRLDSTVNGNTHVSGVQYDSKGNLWMTNSYCPTMLKMMEPNGTWHAYNITTGTGMGAMEDVVAENLLIDSRGYKWVNFPRSGIRYHLIAFSENGTYDNTGDDQLARIDMNAAAEVNSSTVYCMAEDLDGEIWIGTDKGVKVIYYPSKIFKGGVYPRNILLEQDGYVSVLLEFEEVTAIAVDGANRKWIGTSKAGVFLMSENGQEQLLHFTAEDNPLFSNQIVDINVNQLTGEVFFSTAKGLVSYRGTATGGFATYEDLPVFPNPVPHGYAGVVSVNGLKANSLCKITDSSGKLVWQGYSDGGQLVWDCKDHYGNRPATGVYYVMASDENGKEKIVTKFVFIH